MIANNRQLVVSAEAEDDLYSAWHFGAREWSPEQADRHVRDISEMFERLTENPKLGRKREDLISDLRSTIVRPHVIFYRVLDQSIQIIRVLHERADTRTSFRAPK